MRVYQGKSVIVVGGGRATMGFMSGQCVAALVTTVASLAKGQEYPDVGLMVFPPGALQWYAPLRVPYDATGKDGTWHFCPEEAQCVHGVDLELECLRCHEKIEQVTIGAQIKRVGTGAFAQESKPDLGDACATGVRRVASEPLVEISDQETHSE